MLKSHVKGIAYESVSDGNLVGPRYVSYEEFKVVEIQVVSGVESKSAGTGCLGSLDEVRYCCLRVARKHFRIRFCVKFHPVGSTFLCRDAAGYRIGGKTGTAQVYKDGRIVRDVYIGSYTDDMKNGSGIYTWKNGDVYEGAYVNDVRSGIGTYTWASGESYTGEFKDNILSGAGTYSWPSGRVYKGYFENGIIIRAETP